MSENNRETPTESTIEARPRSLGERLQLSFLFRTRRRVLLTCVLGIPLVLCLAYWLFGFIVFADAATLVELKGLVQTRRQEEIQWKPASLNQLLWRHDWLRTGADSSARLLFFDVSTVDLQGETEVSIAQIAKRRGGKAVDVVLKVWFGKTAVRAVRFVDPSSSFQLDTPTASTVVRGARFTVEVDKDGTTQIDLEEGNAEVQIGDQVVVLVMGERITLDPDGLYTTEKIFEPDGQVIFDKVDAAWSASGDRFQLELTETEINQYLAFVSQQQPDFFLRDTQIWFVDGEARVATTVVEPAHFDLSAAAGVQVTNGEIEPQVRSVAAGVALPVPGPVLNPALDWVFDQLQDYLVQVYSFVEFHDVQIKDGYMVVTGRKQLDAPVGP
jgi:hypothetical protein